MRTETNYNDMVPALKGAYRTRACANRAHYCQPHAHTC